MKGRELPDWMDYTQSKRIGIMIEVLLTKNTNRKTGSCFLWHETMEGHSYWAQYNKYNKRYELTDEAVDKLYNYIKILSHKYL